MDCIILAGGKGTRLAPVTNEVPKPLIVVQGKPIIEYLINVLVDKFDRIIIVVDYFSEKIKSYFNNHIASNKIVFVDQNPNLKGTMGALISAEGYIENDFLVICADNIYDSADILNLMKRPNSILIKEVDRHTKDQAYKFAKYSLIKGISNLYLEAGAWFLDKSFLKLKPVEVNNTSELGIPHTLFEDYKNNKSKYTIVFSNFWFPVGTPWELNYLNTHIELNIL